MSGDGAPDEKGDKAPFWRRKTLAEMSEAEWESLCDRCGKCCLILLEDEETGLVYETDVACRLFDAKTCRCRDYENRHAEVPACVTLTAKTVPALDWMPETCAYRLIAEGRDLFDWHPLRTGDPMSARKAGRAVESDLDAEDKVSEAELEDRIVRVRSSLR